MSVIVKRFRCLGCRTVYTLRRVPGVMAQPFCPCGCAYFKDMDFNYPLPDVPKPWERPENLTP
jgi:hypothetical protein